jgi:GT2 family glycosyltransferase
MTPFPTVSVVIPCFNLGEYVDEAIDSVFIQSFQDFEILIVDDGSTDEATRARLAACDRPRTRVVRTENRGLPAAKNLGLRQTTGRYLCMLDADDRLAPTCLERSVTALEQNPAIAFVSHWVRTFGDEDRTWRPERCDFPALLDVNTVNGAALVRRDALLAVGGFDEAMRSGCEDWDLWISLVERGFPGQILPEVLFHYRRRPGSMSRTMLEVEGHPRLYHYLAHKHAGTFRAHLPALLARREQDLGVLRRQIEDLALDDYEETAPRLAWWQDNIVATAQPPARPLQIQPEAARLTAELQAARAALTAATAEALAHHAAAHRAREEAAGLRGSWSWWLTRPLRAIWGRVTG